MSELSQSLSCALTFASFCSSSFAPFALTIASFCSYSCFLLLSGTSNCSTNHGGCVSLCFEVPDGTGAGAVVRCGCADTFITRVESNGVVTCLCGDGQPVNPTTGICSVVGMSPFNLSLQISATHS